MSKHITKNPINTIVVVAALGYFVDIYDLILFGIVRIQSLMAMGITDKVAVTSEGLFLINMQMTGMLIGGLLWGVLGDKRGRISVLFGSIFLYSVANIANAFVTDVPTYGWLRLIAGIGLAGELGAGITLVNETMTKEHRGYGTMVVVSFGVLGAVLAGLIGRNGAALSSFTMSATGWALQGWQIAYIIGGILGLFLLILRIGVYESGMYAEVKKKDVRKGDFFSLFKDKKKFIRYICSISIGVPIWYLIGILITLSPEFAEHLGIQGVVAGDSIMYFYLGTSFGDFMSGYLSQVFKTRKRVVFAYLVMTTIMVPIYLYNPINSVVLFYVIAALLGIAAGYWAVFVTIGSEQFGTNIRSTVTTTVPNFVRGSLPLLTMMLTLFRTQLGLNIANSALLVGIIAVGIAFISLRGLEETYAKDLDYTE